MDSFEKRPKTRPAFNNADLLLEILGWISFVLIWILVILKYSSLPDSIPTHFNAAGKVDDYGGKGTFFISPIIGTIMFVGMTILNRYPYIFNYPVKITADNAERQYTIATRLIRYIKFVIMCLSLIIEYKIFVTATRGSSGLGGWFLPVFLGVIFIPLIVAIVKAIEIK
ncbi:MAG TPA: DUF1648 domain-containing protein [Bacteroidales bacterium]|nr:DUF1648 domain-containing protein [Bacteroidales bacterium]